MLLKYFYDTSVAHASYMVGCQRTKTAIIVDPGRDIQQYLDAAKREGVSITAVAETHIHADYVSGVRELAARVGAKMYVSDEGPAEWKYLYAQEYDHQLLKDGDSFKIGNIRFDVMHTPGHTPESISYVITDLGGGADKPMGIFTGDFVFVGSIGRPDLLEEAAGIAGTAEPGARDLYSSIQRFKQLPDYLQVWPAHGAGSACGKGLGAIPSSTVGYEKLFNPALQYTDEEEFVRYILADQPEAPKYFAVMKKVNKDGPMVLGEGNGVPAWLPADQLEDALKKGTILDLTPAAEFAKGHIPGTLNIPLSMLAGWAGWLLDYSQTTYLIASEKQLEDANRVLRKIGVEKLAGAFKDVEARQTGLFTQTYPSKTPNEVSELLSSDDYALIDVRNNGEWSEGHIEEASHVFLGKLPQRLDEIPREKTIITQCKSGARSAIAASFLQARGYEIINMTGGFDAWVKAGLPGTHLATASASH